MCTSVMKGTPVALCTGGKWSACACTGAMTGAQTAATGTAAMTASTASCGNSKAEGDEQCDGSDLKGMTCMSLGMGAATSMLKCNSRCMFDTLMCVSASATKGTGGTGSAQGGSGAGTKTTGSAGSGGSGK